MIGNCVQHTQRTDNYFRTASKRGVAATLVNLAGGDAVEGGVVVGGCQTELPERYVVDLGLVLRAAERFFRDGELEPTLEWEPY